ncbi:hypothetical protein [Terrimonas pollutisoli]|uniref:hypothetical protein n=1 Tax=Terrimonas pollutisoli TaxID=3034147 RepID=UPI0023ECFB0B|nr:hypothetical protein [Terrimonas sp. H1YJ31]
MKPEALSALKKEIEQNFGRKISSYRDCIQLVEDIYQKTDLNVNVNTIRRFFGLVKTNYAPSHSTLAIFSKYCGFSSIDELENISKAPTNEKDINKEEAFHYLVSLFKNIPVSENYMPVMEPIVQQTIIFLERNPSLIDRFQREIAITKGGQYYYYERCVNMDRLNGYYGDGLKYYLRAKNNNEAKIFANSLLVLRYWMTEDLSLLEKHMKEALRIYTDGDYSPNTMSRFFAARLYYLNAKNDSPEKILSDIAKYYNTNIYGAKEVSILSFDLIICEALTLTNQKTEALDWLKKSKNLSSEKDYKDINALTILENILLNSYAPVKTRNYLLNPKKGKRHPSVQSALNKKYLRILQLSLKPEKKEHNELNTLVEATGYRRALNFKHY